MLSSHSTTCLIVLTHKQAIRDFKTSSFALRLLTFDRHAQSAHAFLHFSQTLSAFSGAYLVRQVRGEPKEYGLIEVSFATFTITI